MRLWQGSKPARPRRAAERSATGLDRLLTTGRDLLASDSATVGGTTLNPGDSFLLGQVSFDGSSPPAAGPVAITFGGATGLTDPNANPLAFTTQDGGITIGRASTVVPEPASPVLCMVGGGSLVLAGCLRRQYAPLGIWLR
jgi:hypothetical protein